MPKCGGENDAPESIRWQIIKAVLTTAGEVTKRKVIKRTNFILHFMTLVTVRSAGCPGRVRTTSELTDK